MIPGYNLEEPTEASALAALQRVFGLAGAEARWAQACADCLLSPGRVKPGAQLERATAALRRQGGTADIVGRSIEIRLRTFARMAANQQASTVHTESSR